MEQNFQGDLTDILRASGSAINHSSGYEELLGALPNNNYNDNNWQFTSGDHHHHHHHHHHQTVHSFPPLLEDQDHQTLLPSETFGDPFSHMGDPLLHGSNIPAFYGGTEAGFFGEPPPPPAGHHAILDNQQGQDVKYRPSCNVFSRMLQLNPSCSGSASANTAKAEAAATASAHCDSPRGIVNKAEDGMIAGSIGMVEGGSSNMSCAGAGAGGGMQISSPRNPGGIKRRKSQAKKVVCIPAPAAANSRASGEVVPSDLWAWRKYGQKPIKGSPYPRGYYRCSSSKGCSARKQVERSRTDPNMLVITYTSEHNHPWPTQRNALAGSTRSQPSKTSNAISKNSPTSSQCRHIQKNTTSPKEEPNSEIILSSNNDTTTSNNNNVSTTSTTSASVKEENIDQDTDTNIEKGIESLDDSAFSGAHETGFGYRPAIMSNVNDQDFFADLGEIEADPLNLLFRQGFSSPTDHQNQQKDMVTGNNNNKSILDHPFSVFDWSGGNSNNNKQRE